ncbi:MAG: 2-hydroxy-3-oxopropionate reductase [Firmicutes bacterium]|nr:2-hydroxy-3-oxopropionate reductase [Bacillota bacterium]
MTHTKIGFIGLGIMGKPMAKNLVKAGYDLVVYDLNPQPVAELVAMGASEGSSPKDVAARTDTVILMLPNSPDVEAVMLGENGVLEGARSNLLVIDMSSIAPIVSQKMAKVAAEKGVRFMDAPVSGGEPAAIEGKLSIMVGADKKDFEEALPILEKMGNNIVLIGKVGSGNTAKLANQIMVAGNIAAMAEAFVLATKAGVDPWRLYKAVRGGLAGSNVLDAKAPLVMEGNFQPGFRIALHIKDLTNVLNTAQAMGVETPVTDLALKMMRHLDANGQGGLDHGGLIRYYEEQAGVEVRGQKE